MKSRRVRGVNDPVGRGEVGLVHREFVWNFDLDH
jgi:hypothetical protein